MKVDGRMQYDRDRGVIYFFSNSGGCLLRIEGVPPVNDGDQVDIHLVQPGNEHHHAVDGSICAVKLGK